MLELVKALTIYIGLAKAQVYAPVIIEASEKYSLDPYLVAAVAYKESRFTRRACFRGAHGVMQIQLNGFSCKKTRQEAVRKGLYNIRTNIFAGARLMRLWKKLHLKYHPNATYHWLLHYNQGWGKCRKRRCKPSERQVITTGKIGKYAKKVLSFRSRLVRGTTS